MIQTQTMNPGVKSAMSVLLAAGWGATLYVAGLIVMTVLF
jgi:hypothetical protein